jgi:hypothetical protein
MTRLRSTPIVLFVATLLSAGCNTQTVRTVSNAPVTTELAQVPEERLLDVGIGVFDPGTVGEKDVITTQGVRNAEARYFPTVLVETLQKTGNWGAVRVIPDRQSETDVWVDGRILQSDGEWLKLEVTVQDATGREWYTRTYDERISKYGYDTTIAGNVEPFQGVYNRIANDMAAHAKNLDAGQVQAIRTVAGLRFAQRFAPQVFAEHLDRDASGIYQVKRLPAQNDPVLQRIARIRERDDVFVDTLQEYYGEFAGRMRGPYHQWRAETYEEAQNLREVRSKAITKTLLSIAAIGLGVAAQGSSSNTARTAGILGIGGGVMLGQDAYNTFKESKIHADALKELSQSFDSEVKPHDIALRDRSVTLTGSVGEQYRQWRGILNEIYASETGAAAGAP